ncbi:MAG: TatD family hydrolase [Patescibacteria group bacterium]|jgi:TatD DNase family protein
MYIDTHCHLNFKDFKEDYSLVANRALAENVSMIVVGAELNTSSRAVELADSFKSGLYSAVGLHPIHLQDYLVKNDNENGKYEFKSRGEKFIEDNYQKLIDKSKKVVAIGEIGLDYYHINSENKEEEDKIKKEQAIVFLKQLKLAFKNNLPVIIHCREAHDDLYRILKDFYNENNFSKDWGVIHCFSGDYEMAQKYFAINLKISFTGLITFNRQWDDVIEKAPLEKIMIETDSPYLTPVPYRGQRNEPLYVKKVAQKIAEIKKISLEEVERAVFHNSLNFFNINDLQED